MNLTVHNVSASYGGHQVLHHVSTDLRDGTITGIVGPNGCGKSTLLKVASRLHRPTAGEVLLGDRPLPGWTRRELARQLARLPQNLSSPPGMTVRELVSLGRHPHLGWHQRLNLADRAIVESVLERCDLRGLVHRNLQTLSGGERQRTWIAMTLAQEPRVLLLDEPTAALDINHQLEVLDLLRELHHEAGLTIVIVMHDLNLAHRYCDHLVVMHRGRIRRDAPALQALDRQTMQEVFGVCVHTLETPVASRPLLDFGRF